MIPDKILKDKVQELFLIKKLKILKKNYLVKIPGVLFNI